MNLHCIGINHRTAPIEVREKIWFSSDEVRSFLTTTAKRLFKESVLISTCNRTELYYIPLESISNERSVWEIIARQKNATNVFLPANFYLLHSLNAVRHLFKV